MEDFAVYILTHGRPKDQKTFKTLRKSGYTGPVYFVCDDMDATLPEYENLYGEQVIVFNKREKAANVDAMDNFGRLNSVVYARNAVFEIAKQQGVKYFAMCDDDIASMSFRYIEGGKLKSKAVKNADGVFEAVVGWLKNDSIATLSLGSQREFIGGNKKHLLNGPIIKVFQVIFCKTDTVVKFRGTFNEDLNAECECSTSGKFSYSVPFVMQSAPERKSNAGGLTNVI